MISSACSCYVSASPPVTTTNTPLDISTTLTTTTTTDSYTTIYIETDTTTSDVTTITSTTTTTTPTVTVTSTDAVTSTTFVTSTPTATVTTTDVVTTTIDIGPQNTCVNFVPCPSGTTSGFQLMVRIYHALCADLNSNRCLFQIYGTGTQYDCTVGLFLEPDGTDGFPVIDFTGLATTGGATFTLDSGHSLYITGNEDGDLYGSVYDNFIMFDGGSQGPADSLLNCEIQWPGSKFVCHGDGGTTFLLTTIEYDYGGYFNYVLGFGSGASFNTVSGPVYVDAYCPAL
jgi:hypothetical protein